MTAAGVFAGRTVLVTGSTRGIGAAAVRLFAEAGARVIVSSRKQAACDAAAADLRAAGHEAIGIAAHAARDEDLAHLVERTRATFGGLDVVIANAGVNPVFDPLETLAPEAWGKVIDTNLAGPWRLARHALPLVARADAGAMVMVSSINAFLGVPGAGAYGIAKAGLNQLVRQLAVEWGGRGVRVNAVAPGTTATDMVRALTAREGWVEGVLRRTPLARLAEPEDIAETILFLASPAARHVTGQVLVVDGGETMARGG